MSRSTLVTALVSLSLLAPVGCATTASDDVGDVAATDDALTAAAQPFIGRYYAHDVPVGGIARLSLNANGKFDASLDSPNAMCVTSPCLLPSSGTWAMTKGPTGALTLRLKVKGEPVKTYAAKKANGQLVLTQAGNSQTLEALDVNQCLDDADCGANEACGVKVCMMACVAGDPFCCGPSTCQPKAPAPKACGGIAGIPCGANEECVDDPSDGCEPTSNGGADCMGICQPKAACWGAWLDQNGTCRTPADGVYPDACCTALGN